MYSVPYKLKHICDGVLNMPDVLRSAFTMKLRFRSFNSLYLSTKGSGK